MMQISDYKSQIINLYSNSYSFNQMSIMLPFSIQSIRRFCNDLIKNGELKKRAPCTRHGEKRKLVQESFLLGNRNLDELAAKFNISKASAQQYLIGIGRSKMPTDKALQIAHELANSEYNCHLFTQISQRYNCTRQYVHYILKNIERYL